MAATKVKEPATPSPTAEDEAKTTDQPTPETEAAPTAEEIEKQTEDALAAAFGPVSSAINAKAQAERADEADAEADKPAPEVEPKVEEPKPKPEPEKKEPEATERFVPAPAAMTPEEVEATARRAAREELDERSENEQPAAQEQAPANPEQGLPEAAQDHLVVLKEMAALNPAHRDLPARHLEFWKKEEKHRAQWEQANPGERFDPSAAEHSAFYQKNEPFVSPRDFKAAERSIVSREAEERAVQRVRKEQEPRLREIELREREREVAPAIANSMADAAEAVFAAAPQFKETFKAKELTKGAIEKMEEINPALATIVKEEAERAAVLVNELERLDRMKGSYRVDHSKRIKLQNGQTIAPHMLLEDEFAECEAALLAKPESERVRAGKKLIRFEEAEGRAQRIRADEKLRPDQKEKALKNIGDSFWWVQAGDVRTHIIAKSTTRVGQFDEILKKSTSARPSGTATEVKPAATPSVVRSASPKAGLARGTSTSSESDTADNTPKGKSEREKNQDALLKSAFA